MDSDNRPDSNLLPTREVPEQVRRELAWFSVEFEASAEEAVAIMVDAAREVRGNFSDLKQVSRSLAGILQDAASLFQLFRELRPGGLPIDEFRSTATRIKVRDLVEKLAEQVPDSEDALRQLLEIAHALKKERIEPEQFLEIAADMGKLMDLRAAIEDLGGTEDRVRALHELGLWLDSKGVALGDVRGFVEFHLKLQKLGFGWKSAHAVALACEKARREGKEGARAADSLIQLAKAGVQLRDEIEELQRSRAKLGSEIVTYSTRHRSVSQEVRTVQVAHRDWTAAIQVLRSEANDLRREYSDWSTKIEKVKALALAELQELKALREQLGQVRKAIEASSAELTKITAASRLLPIVEKALLGKEYSWELLWEIERLCEHLRSRRGTGIDEEALRRIIRIIELAQKSKAAPGGNADGKSPSPVAGRDTVS